ncbi:hypothetical protein NXK88_002863 [Enterococcus hirae]|uniref:DUF5411 family protein n=1 Tax=Enterococcus hirae TaxID=1354 RepID=UPI002072F98B|nr:DUF5411 family protein [Enterococcus hirae]EMF0203573.1 hypothetical protein [Enterococcus hirae]
MLSNFVKTIGLLFIAFLATILLIVFSTKLFQQNFTTQSVQEALQVSVTNNIDKSIRVKKGTFYINKEKFEEDFLKELNVKKNDVQFNYLETNNFIKAIKVKVTSNGKKYQGTLVVDLSTD